MGSLTLEQALAVIDGTFQAGQKSHSAALVVGVSGDISDLDESCALRGITHADLFCDENAV
ncbi:hypothetical protein [Vibrio neptunius]|uniref:Uncharacterized protein n=1 Tax=Vibrio neptunius TaxID=170651 RepID=A0ABS2ZZM0_9VIBR|nr:hypothetical protein [Vibrio neptunius]MBN3492905.1 hypothetical protein [Vibrio neptunius]MBN3515377.1 hypothetical protein [Vibrio neptunius]MBN3549437.1 hypothetical protein [Vibrio neptunius]MBN3577706.1 hypothetical protein [Vibrio neptunius]MCH9871370.1 hypothetical protein [Vibrio neptunius]